MAVLPIRRYPDPALLKPSEPVATINQDLRTLADDMIETMKDASGVGLAAPQVGVNVRLVTIDRDPEKHDPIVLVNPVFVRRSKEKETAEEGCLSFPGLRVKLKRHVGVTCQAQDLEGNVFEIEADGLISRALQHEMDHLDGIVFVARLGAGARRAVRGELEAMTEAYRLFHPNEN